MSGDVKPVPIIAAALLLGILVVWRRRLAWPVVAAGLTAIAALAVYGSGAVHIPNLEHAIRAIGPRLGGWTYLLVAGLAFLESGAFVGLVAPGEFAVVFGGFVAGQGVIDPLLLAVLVAAAALTGDLVSFVLGRRLGRGFIERRGARIGLDRARVDALEGFYGRHGGKTIVLGRFVGFARALSPFVAGASRMPFLRFLAFDLPAAVIWSTTFVVLGFVFWESFDRVLVFARRGNVALSVVVVVLVAGVALVRTLRSPEGRHRLGVRLRRRPSASNR
jgi:membrane protein DedA with SNARE-associated domain